MDPAVAALDIAKAGVILANMIESYLAGGAAIARAVGCSAPGSVLTAPRRPRR
jgi:hypothetical protein